MRLEHIRVVLRQNLLDMIRDRGTIFALFAQPLIFVVVLGFIGYIAQQRSNAFATTVYKVAFVGTPDDIRPFEQLLTHSHFKVRHPKDAERALIGGDIEIGFVVSKDAAKDITHGRQGHIELMYAKTNDASQVALGRVRVLLDAFSRAETERRVRLRGLDPQLTKPLAVQATDSSAGDKGGRVQLASLLPGLVLLQGSSLMSTVSGRLSGSKENRTFEPLYVLPIKRFDLLAGIGLSSLLVGAIPVVMFIVPIVMATLLPIALAHGVTSPVSVAASLLMGGLPLALLAVALGLAVGTTTRTGSSGNALGTMFYFPFLALGILFQSVDSLPAGLSYTLIPAYGAASFMREAIVNGIDPVQWLVLAGSSILYSAILIRIARTFLETERSVLRAS